MNCALRFRTFAPTNSTETLASFCQPALISAPRVLCAHERAGDKDPCSGRACFANGSKSLVCGRDWPRPWPSGLR